MMEGYDAKFESALDKRFECPICLLAQRDPMQTLCGHRFCASCIMRALNETGPRCPIDNLKCTPNQLFLDNFAKREILSLPVCCHGDKEGCLWRGELRYLRGHLRECNFVISPCPNGCEVRANRKVLMEHLLQCPNKTTACPFCKVTFSRTKLQVHEPNCSKYMLNSKFLRTIEKRNETLKWCGKMTLRGQSSVMTCCLTLPSSTESGEENPFCTAHWNGTFNLIPLLEAYSKVFFSIINVRQQSWAQMNFHFAEKDAATQHFDTLIKNQVNAFVCPVARNATGPNWVVIMWCAAKRRVQVHLVEIRGYVLKQLLAKLKQLKDSRPRPGRRTSVPDPLATPHAHRHVAAPGHFPATVRAPGSFPSNIRAPLNPYGATSLAGPIHTLPHDPTMDGSVMPAFSSASSFPTWCPLPAGTAAPGGGSFFTFPTSPTQYLPTHWHPVAPFPHCCLFKHVGTVRTPPQFPNYSLPEFASIMPPVVIGGNMTQVPTHGGNAANVPGPSRLSGPPPLMGESSLASSRRAEESRNESENDNQRDSISSPNEMSHLHGLLTALRRANLYAGSSSSSNSTPVMSPLSSSSSASSPPSVGSPSSDVSGNWPTSSREIPEDQETTDSPSVDMPQQLAQEPVGHGSSPADIQHRLHRSRSGNFYLSSGSVPSPLEALANAATVLEGRVVSAPVPPQQGMGSHPVVLGEASRILTLPPLASPEAILQPHEQIFPPVAAMMAPLSNEGHPSLPPYHTRFLPGVGGATHLPVALPPHPPFSLWPPVRAPQGGPGPSSSS